MSNMKWYTMTKPDDAQGTVADEATGKTIAVTYEAKHAQLVAAAPLLLEAAIAARKSVRHSHQCKAPWAFPCSCDADEVYKTLGDAITKAGGVL